MNLVYRLVRKRTTLENNETVFGILYCETDNPDKTETYFETLKSVKPLKIRKKLNDIQSDDLNGYVHNVKFQIGATLSIEINEDDEEWTPDVLIRNGNRSFDDQAKTESKKVA